MTSATSLQNTLKFARSYLFVPASRTERIAKALAARADVVIVDLEDAVALESKQTARSQLAQYLDAAPADTRVVVRINAIETEWYASDAELCRHRAVMAVMLPKAEHALSLADLTAKLASEKPLIPLVETARGVWNAKEIAAVPNVLRLALGPLDLQVDLGVQGDEALAPHRAHLVLASRVAGVLAPIDGPTASFDDAAVISADAQRGRREGFSGKLCIHPKQVDAVNGAFSPSAAEIEWAQRVMAVNQASGGQAATLDGAMLDRPVYARAEAILQRVRS